MTRRELKIEFWVAVVLLSASVSGLGFLAFSVAHGRFPESLIPFVDAFYGTNENAAVAADLGTKLGVALVSAFVAGLGCFAHYLCAMRKLSDVANGRYHGGG